MRRLSGLAAFALFLAFFLTVGGCSDSSKKGDGGIADDFIAPVTCPEGVDPSVDVDTAIDLAEGKETSDYICPRKDADYYKVVIPAGKGLLRINLQHTAAVTQVNLTYRIVKLEGKDQVAVGSAPPNKTNNYAGVLHCLSPGTYYLIVQDSGDDAADGKSTYRLSYTTEADKDANEPNESEAKPTAIGGTPVTGYISCTGDRDFYQVTAAADELLDIKLTTAKTTPVDLRYTLYKKNGQNLEAIASSFVSDGAKEPTTLQRIYPTPGAGTYYLVVEDDGGDDSDADTPYTLTVAKRAEPDANDKGTRNDHPKQATKLGAATGSESCASPAVFTRTGRIASIADSDVYEITGPATLPAGAPPVMEIEVKFSGATVVDPSVNLIMGDPATSCTEDRCCQALGGAQGSCGDVYDCNGTSFTCITRSQEFCNECIQGADQTCAQKKSCSGAVMCLANAKCGYSQVTRYTENGATLRTAQPLLAGGPWYVRVSDFAGDEYDYDATYTLTVKVCGDPDGAKEPNGGYFPRLITYANKPPEKDSAEFTSESVQDFFESQGKKLAKPGPVIPTDGSFSPSITGFISYQHDEDWYTIANPCPGAICLLQAEYTTTGSGCSTSTKGEGLEFVYLLDKGGNDQDGFPDPKSMPLTGSFGYNGSSGPCGMLLRPGMAANLRLTVTDLYHNNWSTSCGYSIRFKVSHSGSCPVGPCAISTDGKNTCYVP